MPGARAPSAAALRAMLAEGRARLREAYEAGRRPGWLLRAHARLVDRVLLALRRAQPLPATMALVATGGYGRRELYPCSDVDLLVLLGEEPDASAREALGRFVGMLWDVGLEVGHSVRTVDACVEAARADVTIQTALLEARPLPGAEALYRRLARALAATLDPRAFLAAKKLEQEQRHAKQQDTPYALEPNLKEAPGGLRDLQVIRWIARAAGLGERWRDLVARALIERGEARALARHEAFLQDLRIRLHYLAGRREDRILFDHQAALAARCGIGAGSARRASELLMQRYYRTAKAVTQLNTILLQNIEALLAPGRGGDARVLNERFRAHGGLLEARREDLFAREPRAILEAFLLMQQHQDLRGMSAPTLRALWRARRQVAARLRRDPIARLLFVQILQQPRGIVHEFRRMNQYDVLGGYLPEFGRIVGQMQHDLFHVYTVDQHVLTVVRNLRRFTMPEFAHEFPLCTQLMAGFERRWLLYVAALFHDIAKGRGGDHSLLGARDARRFCRRHGFAAEDTELVAFLVEHHLAMSRTAQKQDVHDPAVARAFAALVGDERRLTALYLLTVADIRGTSPKVWNAWKAKLLEDLYWAARRALAGETPPAQTALAERQTEALRLLRLAALSDEVCERFWSQLDTGYFLRHDAREIAWHTRSLYDRVDTPVPVVRARPAPFGEGLQVMVYTRDRAGLFARICGYFERGGFNIVEAKIHTTRHGYALDTFQVLSQDREAHYRDLVALTETGLAGALAADAPLEPPRGARLSRRVRHFPIAPSVDLRSDERGDYHALSIVAADRPGLLYDAARVLAAHGVSVHSARINTLGDRAEDVFLVSGASLADPKEVLRLEQELLQALQVPPTPQAAALRRGTAPR
ncbi:MAG: [protein-PII] uridylyltransferase [Burkholderiales bacterium]|nr:[protein-PII] uridylyltransferase [Burkholderiales bacterium]